MVNNSKLPDNTITTVANAASNLLKHNKPIIDMPIYISGNDKASNQKGWLHFRVPEGTEIEISVEIPFKDNLTDQDISLDSAMELMANALSTVRSGGVYGAVATIEKHIVKGNQIMITRKYVNNMD